MKKPPPDGLGVRKVKGRIDSYRPGLLSSLRSGLGFQQAKSKNQRVAGAGEAPSMGEVERMHKNALQRLPVRYATVLAIFFFGLTCMFVGGTLTAAVLWWFGGIGSPRQARTIQLHAPKLIEGVPAPEPQVMEDLVKRLLAARTAAEVEPLVRPGALSPAAIAARLPDLERQDGKIRRIRYLRPIDSLCLRLESVLVTFDSGRNRIALLSPDEEKRWRIDFDGYTRRAEPEFAELMSGAAEEATVRVQVIPDNYYNGPYLDDEAWACFALPSPDHETMIFGYVARGSRQHAAIARSLVRSERRWQGGMQRMTLRIRRAGTDPRQFEIVRVLADDWAVGAQPLDELQGGPSAK
jgi:hypothetical protein